MKIPQHVHETIIRISENKRVSPMLLKKTMKEILPMPDDIVRTSLLSNVLNGLMARGPKKNEIVPLIESIFDYCNYRPFTRVVSDPRINVIGIIGSGKKGYKTLNISSASSILAAGMGCYVVKPMSSSASSVTGSADFFEICGVKNGLRPDESVDILEEVGIVPLKIEDSVKKFDDAYGRRFFATHALSFGLPPLICDIKYNFLLYGIAHPNVKLSADVLRAFNINNALIYSSTYDDIHFIDEMGIFGTTRLIGISNGCVGKLRYLEPTELLGLPRYSPKDIQQRKTPHKNVSIVLAILAGKTKKETEAIENIICINVSNILFASGKARELNEGYKMAKSIIRTGVGFETLKKLVAATGGNPNTPETVLKEALQ